MKRRYVIEVTVDTDTPVWWSALIATPVTGEPLGSGTAADVTQACLRAAQVCVNDARTVGMLT